MTARESHAFPEVYISGYGWMSFEPTVATEQIDIALSARKINVLYAGINVDNIYDIYCFICDIYPQSYGNHF